LLFRQLFGEFPQKLMSCWRSYCAVSVPALASTVFAGLPSAVDAVMFLLSQMLWPPSMLLPASLFLQGSLLLIAINTVLAVLLLLSFLLLLAILLLLAFLLLTAFLLLHLSLKW
jgi:hypothetical protein